MENGLWGNFIFWSLSVVAIGLMHLIHTFFPLRTLFCTFPGLSTPKGLRFSEVSDSSAVVHWSTPRSPVDNYRITYVPFEGGKSQN